MGLEIKRISDIKQKLHPNQKLRAWYASHTFGGTTKAKSLKILGFSKTKFYYIAAATGVVAILAAVGIAIGVQHSVQKARVQGAAQGVEGEQFITKATRSRTRTYVSAGNTIVTTEVATQQITSQRGGGLTQIVTKGEGGQKITVPGSLQLVTNTAGDIDTITYIGSTALVSNGDIAEIQTYFGDPTIITSNGESIETTIFSDVSVVTGQDGEVSTSFEVPEPTSDTSSGQGTDSSSATATGASSSSAAQPGQSSGSATNAPSTSSASAPSSSTSQPSSSSPGPASSSASSSSSSSSSKPSSSSSSSSGSSSSGGGGGGEEFEGEATFYAPGLGSCGTDATDADYVAALSKVLFDATGATNSNANPYCGRKALVKAAGGKKRRWQSDANSTAVITTWERSRNERLSRRSVLAVVQGLELPTQVQNGSGMNSGTPKQPQNSRITPAPQPRNGMIKRQAGGGGVTITIVDRCPVCKQYDLDLSPAAYNVLGDADAGRIPIKWSWLD